jgi:predicted porin
MTHALVRRALALACAVCAGTAGTACAQTPGLTLSGLIDIGIQRGADHRWRVGPIQRSHLRLDAVDDLGGGVVATAALSHRFDPGNGGLESTDMPFWHGESTVGLRGPFGSVQFGRRLDALYSLDWEFDPWANFDRIASPAWDLWHVNYPSDPRGNNGQPEYGRLNNGVFYDSPRLAGLSLHLSGAVERQAGDSGRAGGVALRQAIGPVSGVLARQRNSRGDTESFLGLRLSLGALDLMGARDLSRSGASAAPGAASWTLGASYVAGLWTWKAGWGDLALDGQRAQRMLGLGVQHALSKRTAVYVDVGHRRFVNDMGTASAIGLAHRF